MGSAPASILTRLTPSQCANLPRADVSRCVNAIIWAAAMIAVAVVVVHVVAHAAFVHTIFAFLAGFVSMRTADAPATDGGGEFVSVHDGSACDGGSGSRRSSRRNSRRKRSDVIKDLAVHPRTKSEQQVIDIFETLTGEKFPTVSPAWLVYKDKQLELDGMNDTLKIAVEFSGPLHTKWFPNREPYAKFLERVQRDEAKIRICRANGVRLFVIDMRIPRHNLYAYVKSRLYDAGVLPQPSNYLPEEIYKPDIDYTVSTKSRKSNRTHADDAAPAQL